MLSIDRLPKKNTSINNAVVPLGGPPLGLQQDTGVLIRLTQLGLQQGTGVLIRLTQLGLHQYKGLNQAHTIRPTAGCSSTGVLIKPTPLGLQQGTAVQGS